MKKVRYCFGRFGERECMNLFCEDELECKKVYSNYFNKYFDSNENRFISSLKREIERYMNAHKIKFKEKKK